MGMTARHTEADNNLTATRKQNKPIGAAVTVHLEYGLRPDREKGNGICVEVGALPPIRTRPYQIQGPTRGRAQRQRRQLPTGTGIKSRLQQAGGCYGKADSSQ